MFFLQPTSTLFPYTTLFRSKIKEILKSIPDTHTQAIHDKLLYPEAIVSLLESSINNDPPISIKEGNIIKDGYNEQLEDRKSTRLNSSHVAISYAVFCLKKKT